MCDDTTLVTGAPECEVEECSIGLTCVPAAGGVALLDTDEIVFEGLVDEAGPKQSVIVTVLVGFVVAGNITLDTTKASFSCLFESVDDDEDDGT